jgi:ferredoxin
MSEKISRRALLPLLPADPNDQAPEPRPFSIGDFYARRSPSPNDAPLPQFAVRTPEADHRTTSVGVTRTAVPPWRLHREPRAGSIPKLGGPVMVVRSACLAWQGSPCWTCSERCPVDGAISLDAGRPVVDVARCDGCGECVAACPAPHNALKLVEHALPGKAKEATT